MADGARLVVAAFVLLLLGASFLVRLVGFEPAYAVPAAVVYGLLALVLLWRVLIRSFVIIFGTGSHISLCLAVRHAVCLSMAVTSHERPYQERAIGVR